MKVTKNVSITQVATFSKKDIEDMLRAYLVANHGPEWATASWEATHETIPGHWDDDDREEFSGIEFRIYKSEKS